MVAWLMGGTDDDFMDNIFGRQWMISRSEAPRIFFDANDTMDLLNMLDPLADPSQRLQDRTRYDLPRETFGSSCGAHSVVTPHGAASLMKFKSASMIKTFNYMSDSVTNHSRIASFLRERALTCSDDLAERGEQWTFILNLVHGATADMRALHHSLWAFFGLGGGFNAYLTAPDAQGLNMHTDPHDVFVLQQGGRKRWYLLEPKSDGVFDTICDTTLTPGDVLYLPAGIHHYAESTSGEPSLHLAVGVYRGFFSAAGILAAWLELDGCTMPDTLTDSRAGKIDGWRKRLSSRGNPWDSTNQLLAASSSIPLLRAFDRVDLSKGVDAAAAAELVQIASRLAANLTDAEDPEGVDASRRLHELGRLSEQEQVDALMDAIFAIREYHWVKHYSIHQAKELRRSSLDVRTPPPGARLRRCADASAMRSSRGALLLNGYQILELPEGAMDVFRFCMGVHTGAAGKEFYLRDVPGSKRVVASTVKVLLQLEGLEQLSEAQS